MKFKVLKPKNKNSKPLKFSYKNLIDAFKKTGSWEESEIEIPNHFRRANLSWDVFYDERKAIVKDSKGMKLIHFLIQHYSKGNFNPVSLNELEGLIIDPEVVTGSQENLPSDTVIDNAFRLELLDKKAIQTIYKRLRFLESELEHSDLAESERESFQDEKGRIEEIIRSDTFQGKSKMYSEQEKLQERIRKNIKDALANIREVHEPLYSHLDQNIIWKAGWLYLPPKPEKWTY